MYNLYTRLNHFINTLIAPPHCAYCKILLDNYTVLCTNCYKKLKEIPSVSRTITSNYTLTIHAVSSYQDPLKSLILAKGASNYTASKQLAYILWHYSIIKKINFDYLVAIPLHWTRYAARGYNQAAVIAHELSRLSGKPVAYCLKRKKRTAFQSVVESAERRKQNVSDAFELIHEATQEYTGKTLVLVDDLMTTGATLEAASKVLVTLQPAALHAVVACRVI